MTAHEIITRIRKEQNMTFTEIAAATYRSVAGLNHWQQDNKIPKWALELWHSRGWIEKSE